MNADKGAVGQTRGMRIDRDVVCRAERAAASIALAQAAAFVDNDAAHPAAAEAFDSGALVAFGPGRYVNRAMAVGLGRTSADTMVATVTDFYASRGLPPSLELSPWAPAELFQLLGAAGFRVQWFRNVYVRDLADLPPLDPTRIEAVTEHTSDTRKYIISGEAAKGTDARRISDEYCDAAARVTGSTDCVALTDGAPVACASLTMTDGVAQLGGANTLEAHRGRGLQSALLVHRLHAAAAAECTLATATALPDGQSARNLERLGFVALYTQAVLTRP